MRIGINTLAFAPGRSGGDGTYVRHLVRTLSQGVPAGERAHYVVFAAPWNAAALAPLGPQAILVPCPAPGGSFAQRALWEQLALPRLVARHGLDALHAPVNVAPLAVPLPQVLTVHDVSPFLPESRAIPLPLRLYWRAFRRASARRAAAIIAVSHASAAQVVRALGVPRQAVRVVYHGVAPAYLDAPDSPLAQEQEPPLPGCAPGYLLWVGRTYPSKNLPVLLRALDRLRRRGPRWADVRLALVGRPGWDEAQVQALIRQLGLGDRVVRLGHTNEPTLRRLYRHAAALALPSTDESFGLPLLEAMACGTPVVAARLPSLVEVGGAAAHYVGSHDIAGWADALAETLAAWREGSPALAARRAQGRARASAFRWERTAAATASVYAAVAALPARW
jgi:glycosyltransferase involved in cell wall biosynthesis